MIPVCQFGYLELTGVLGETLYVKANKIYGIENAEETESYRSIISCYDDMFRVMQTTQEIFALLEAIHPTMR